MEQLFLKSMMVALGVLLSLHANAYDVQINGIYYNLDTSAKTATVTSGSIKYTGAVDIPSSFNYNGSNYLVTSIGSSAFSASDLTAITIPNSVTSIGNSAFSYCISLTSVTIPNSVTSIGDYAFSNSDITSVISYNGLETIGVGAFTNCSSLTSVGIPSSVTTIGKSAFWGCTNLPSIAIPESVAIIDEYTFYGCSGLTSVGIPSSVTSIGKSAFRGCTNLTSIAIPNSVTSIDYYAFGGCHGLTSVDIPSSITNIGDCAFSSCGLTSVTIPNSLTTIGNTVFSDCRNLTSVTIPSSVTNICNSAFYGCISLTSVSIPNSVTDIESWAFGNTALTSVTIPNSVTFIGNNAFANCGDLTSVNSEIENPFYNYNNTFFSNISSNCVLTVPYGTKDAYIAAGWTEDVFKGGIVEAEPVTEPSTDNTLSLTDTQVLRGRQITLPVNMSNTEDITALQFDLTLPAGVSIAKNSNGKYIVTKTDRCADHTLSASKPGEANVYRVLLYSTEAESISGNEGAVINVTLEAAEDMEAGDYEVRISSINLTTTAEKKITPADATCVLTVRNSIPGDANGDGSIDVTDIVGIANSILGRPSESFDAVAADVNGDGSVDVTDIVVVANIILHDGGTNAANVRGAMQMLDPQ